MQRSLNLKHPGIYILHDEDAKPGGRDAYLGSSGNMHRRLTDHQNLLKNGKHHNYRLQQAFDQGHRFTITAIPTQPDVLLEVEQTLLDEFLPTKRLFNIAVDASAPMKGRTITEETREKLRARPPKVVSPEEREKIVARMSGRVVSAETRAKISAASMGRGNPGLIHSDEAKEKLRQARSIPIVYNGVNYPSTKAAAIALGVSETQMYRLRKQQTKD